ncbi:MAG TPA: PilZ domain-containing protein, partial [Myxococcales bacterium]|nr:PilZ domain-containing protein [Myxococcales bacterium]
MRHQTGLEPSHLVRYRFDTQQQLRKHVHAANAGRRYFFLRDPAPQFATGARVVLEVSFRVQPQRCVLHGMVRWRDHGSQAMAWLELPKIRLHHRRPLPASRRRKARRLPADLMAEIRPAQSAPFVCRILDLAEHGVRVFAGTHQLRAGPLAMTLLPAEGRLLPVETVGRVVWARANEIGIEMPGHADGSHKALLESLDQAWRGALV